jgi:hypothetical protein
MSTWLMRLTALRGAGAVEQRVPTPERGNQKKNAFLFPLPYAFLRCMGKMTQKEFVEAVREIESNDPYCLRVDYRHPGLFQVGERRIKIEMRQIARFLVKLSAAMKFDHYDRLTRTVYIQHMQAERKAAYAIAEDRPQGEAKQNRIGTYTPS